MPLTIRSGKIYIYHLFDVADTIDVARLQKEIRTGTLVKLVARRPTPQYIQFVNPPLSIPLGPQVLAGAGRNVRAAVRAKFFDYGATSIIWELDSPEDFEDLLALTISINENPLCENQSRQILNELMPKIEPALQKIHPDPLLEDYIVFYFRQFDRPLTGYELLRDYDEDLARLMRGEARSLSPDEKTEALRKRIAYYENDMVIIDWNTAIIVDPEESTEHLDILEFANTELLELRYYDRLLDRELDSVYRTLDKEPSVLGGYGGYHRNAQKLMALLVDVIELTENIENAIKIIGDLYSARIYRAIAARLRLYEWKASVDNKLQIVNQIYHNRIERLNTARFVILEVIIILLIVVEIILFLVPHS